MKKDLLNNRTAVGRFVRGASDDIFDGYLQVEIKKKGEMSYPLLDKEINSALYKFRESTHKTITHDAPFRVFTVRRVKRCDCKDYFEQICSLVNAEILKKS